MFEVMQPRMQEYAEPVIESPRANLAAIADGRAYRPG
jgi:hypothetical protein